MGSPSNLVIYRMKIFLLALFGGVINASYISNDGCKTEYSTICEDVDKPHVEQKLNASVTRFIINNVEMSRSQSHLPNISLNVELSMTRCAVATQGQNAQQFKKPFLTLFMTEMSK